MAEEKYTSKFDGKTSDAIMDYSNKLRQQTSATDADTIQVFDTSGNPHKISKSELLKKSALALPSLNDISAFVAVNQAGNAVGVMSKEQVATVLGGLQSGKVDKNSYSNTLKRGVYSHTTPISELASGYSFTGVLLVLDGNEYTAHVDIMNDGKLRVKTIRTSSGETISDWSYFDGKKIT